MTQVDRLDPAPTYRSDGFLDPAVGANPQPFYRSARQVGAVVEGSFGPQVVSGSAVDYVLHHPEQFSSAMEAVDLGQSVPLIPLQVDPPDHVKYRRLLDPIFAPRQINRLEPDIAAMVNERIDSFIDRGGCDLADELAVPIPSSVFLGMLGFPLSQLDVFLAMKDGILRPGGDDLDEMRAGQRRAASHIEDFFAEAISDHRRHPSDDILGLLLAAEVDGQRLTQEEIVGICFLFVLAGLDTVTDSLECFFAYLAQHPDQRRAIVEDPGLIPSAVEELLRWETPVTAVPRMATVDIDLGGCPLRQGDHVGVCIGSANTDEDIVPDAFEVNLGRSPNKHAAFGAGIHRCLGSHLARLELRTTLREWHSRIPEYHLAPNVVLSYSMGLRQVEHLPLVFGA
ncbi:MAG: cytochrome P450 [Acidimicrobiales bacterium]